jgi:tripartite-type tricarboxylate transporter receptor subunit TctC
MKTSLRRGATPSPQRRSRPRVNDRPYPKTRPSGQHPRRQFLRLAVGAAALPAVSCDPGAQSYPSRPITMIVPFPAGGGTDAVGRVVVERMRELIGQPIIIENVGGADGSIGVGRAALARPDGYTIVLGVLTTHVLNGAFYALRYDVLNDFAPVAPLVTTPIILCARKTLPANDLRELIAWLKANPNRASAGIQTVGFRLLMAFFQKETGTQFTLVPYRGSAPAMQDLMAGHIDLAFGGGGDSLALIQAGRIKAYAVTSDTRTAIAPDIPTFAEIGLLTVPYSEWIGLFAPRSTPRNITGKLNTATVEAMADPEVRSRLGDLGMEIFPRERQTPEALAALVKADAEKWWPVMKQFGIKAE